MNESEIGQMPLVPENKTDLMISREPEIVLQEAQKAAKALQEVIANKKNPFMLHGEQYIEYDDWMLIGKFYGVTAKVKETMPIEIGDAHGWEAKATIVRLSDGMEISGAEAMCLNDEPNWKSKPMFQLRSMAQTRACAKALRNVLAWVVMLAGYKTTPAEEVENSITPQAQISPKPIKPKDPLKQGIAPQKEGVPEAVKNDMAFKLEQMISWGLGIKGGNIPDTEALILECSTFPNDKGKIIKAKSYDHLMKSSKWFYSTYGKMEKLFKDWMKNEDTSQIGEVAEEPIEKEPKPEETLPF